MILQIRNTGSHYLRHMSLNYYISFLDHVLKSKDQISVHLYYEIIYMYCNLRVRVIVFNATFNKIVTISWRSVLLVEKTGVPGENHRPAPSHWQTLSHCIIYTSSWPGFELTTVMLIGTDCTGSCKSNYYMVIVAPIL